jgi:mannan endo-1,4-beta-mannosidase
MMFRADDVDNRQRVIDQAKTEWRNGSLVALTWHACSPTVGRTCEFDGGVKTSISASQFQQIVTGGTALNQTWRSRMAEVVPYLKQLRDAGVPVLWRPFHEMNETWNWWGGRPGTNGGARIFQQMRDYFDSQGLDNLIWVWNVQDNPAGGWSSYYPGSDYVDVVSLDAWYKSYPSTADYQQIQSIAAGKPIAIAEMGKVPNSSLLTSQTRWAYFHDLVRAVAGQQRERRDPGGVLPSPRSEPGRGQDLLRYAVGAAHGIAGGPYDASMALISAASVLAPNTGVPGSIRTPADKGPA